MNTIDAFDVVCGEVASTPERHYVCLMLAEPYYGGPEEGGWWGEDITLVKYAEYPTLELADAAADRVDELASSLSTEASNAFNQGCLDSLNKCDERGQDYDSLPEVDGSDRYYVIVTCELPPLHSYGCRHYE